MEKIEFTPTISSLTKSELAGMYLPNVSISSSLKQFNKWIKESDGLQEELTRLGVTPYTRRYTPRQVRIIFKYLGTP